MNKPKRNFLGWNKWGDKFNWRRLWDIPFVYSELRCFFREIKWAAQRAIRGVDDTIHWNGDGSIAAFIYLTIDKLYKSHHGVPAEIATKFDDVDLADKMWTDILSEGRRRAWVVLHVDDVYMGTLDNMDEIVAEDISRTEYVGQLNDKYKFYKHYSQKKIKEMYEWLTKWHSCLWD